MCAVCVGVGPREDRTRRGAHPLRVVALKRLQPALPSAVIEREGRIAYAAMQRYRIAVRVGDDVHVNWLIGAHGDAQREAGEPQRHSPRHGGAPVLHPASATTSLVSGQGADVPDAQLPNREIRGLARGSTNGFLSPRAQR